MTVYSPMFLVFFLLILIIFAIPFDEFRVNLTQFCLTFQVNLKHNKDFVWSIPKFIRNQFAHCQLPTEFYPISNFYLKSLENHLESLHSLKSADNFSSLQQLNLSVSRPAILSTQATNRSRNQ